MRVHFWRRHVWDIVIIMEEGNLPHPRCSRCDMLVPWRSLNGKHKSTAVCRSGLERERRRLAETEIRESTEMAFEVYGKQLQTVPSFKYPGRLLTAGDEDWPAVAGNLDCTLHDALPIWIRTDKEDRGPAFLTVSTLGVGGFPPPI